MSFTSCLLSKQLNKFDLRIKEILFGLGLKNRRNITMWDKWFLNKELSTDWTSMHFDEWDSVFNQLQIEGRVNVLEIGSWEGRSAIYFLNRLPLCTLTCIDTFEGKIENNADTWQNLQIPKMEERFNKNLEAFSARYKKIKKSSSAGLSDLISQGEMFDVIFIDGSHQHDDVCVDSLLAI